MSNSRIIKNDLEYILFNNIYQLKYHEGSNRKAFFILETWIDLVNRRKNLNVTLADLSVEIDLPRSTIQYYFSGIRELRQTAFKYVRVLYQYSVVESLNKSNQSDPKLLFKAYFDSALAWPKVNIKYSFLWIQFLSLSLSHKSSQLINFQSVETGFKRLVSLIEQGQKSGVFSIGRVEQKARIIQVLLSGAVLAQQTEKTEILANQNSILREHCLDLLLN